MREEKALPQSRMPVNKYKRNYKTRKLPMDAKMNG